MSAFTFNNSILTIRDCKYGAFAFYNSDSPIGSCLTSYGEWAEPELQFISPFLLETSRVLDIGANIGTHSVFFSKKCHKGIVHAIEPQFYIHQVLVTNLVLNNCFNVKAYNAAISNDYQSLKLMNLPPFSKTPINYGEFKVHNHEHGTDTPCMKINQFNDVTFIKLDVEGHELSCLQSGEDMLKKNKPLMYIEFNCKEGNKELIEFIWSLGYDCYMHVYKKFSADNFHRQPVNIWLDDQADQPTLQTISKFFEGNIFCVPKKQKLKIDLPKIKNSSESYVDYLIKNELIK